MLDKLINVIKALYYGSSCRVLHRGKLTDNIVVTAGAKQGCLLSPLLFIVVLDDVMRRVTCKCRQGLPWTADEDLEDIDFADDICLLATNRQQLQNKADDLVDEAEKVGLRINFSKTKEMGINTTDSAPMSIKGRHIEQVGSFCYLGSIVDDRGGTEADIAARINKARAAFSQLRPVWSSSTLTRRTKVRIFNSNVKSVLLYGSETWFVRKDLIKKLQVFVNKCLRQILKIFWPEKITNKELWRITKQTPMEKEILTRKWHWIGHTLRKPDTHLLKKALT